MRCGLLLGEVDEFHSCRRHVSHVAEAIDEGVQEWRYRHVKMVERIIGFKAGAGGSAGSEYLRSTLFRPAFPDLDDSRVTFLAACVPVQGAARLE